MDNINISDWKYGNRFFILLDIYVDNLYKNKKIKKNKKSQLKKRIDFMHEYFYWNKNPFIKDNSLFLEMAKGILNDLYSR
jgi:hypothetical protein